MYCLAYSTATAYRLKALFNTLKMEAKATWYKDVVYVQDETTDIFFFSYGALIAWTNSASQATKWIEKAKPFEVTPLEEIEFDDFTYVLGKKAHLEEDVITLPDSEIHTKLALSFGLAQSAKLGTFENTVAKVFEKTKKIPEDLAKRGRISLSRKAIRKKMGELFIERSYVNVHVDILDTPEFFWEYPELESLYTLIANELEISRRGEVLNQRLDVIRELFEMLGNELNHQHSSRLEWIIIWLIAIEVVITLLDTFGFL